MIMLLCPHCLLPSLTSITPFLSRQLWPSFGYSLNLGQKTPHKILPSLFCAQVYKSTWHRVREGWATRKALTPANLLGRLPRDSTVLPIYSSPAELPGKPTHSTSICSVVLPSTSLRFWNDWHNKFSPQKGRAPHAREQRSFKNNCKASQGI